MMSKLPEGWSNANLSHITTSIQYGYTASASSNNIGPRLLRITDIQNNKVDWSKVPFCECDNPSNFLLNSGDIVIARTGATTGKSYFIRTVNQPAVFASYLIRVRAAKSVLPEYLSHYLQTSSYWNQIQISSKGIAQPGVNASALSSISIPLPPLAEQHRIVEKLDRLTERSRKAREELERIPKLVERYKAAVLSKAFRGELPKRVNEKISSNDAWKESMFGQICQLIDGDRGPNYPKQSDYQSEGYCLFLSTKNVRPNGFSFSECVFINELKHKQLRNGTIQYGDLIITTRGTIGNVALYDNSIPFSVIRINSGMLILRRTNDDLLGAFLFYYIMSSCFRDQIESKRTGSAQPQLPAGVIKTFTISYPNLSIQQEIVRQIESAFTFIEEIAVESKSASSLLTRLDQQTLAKAFRGELVPQDPSDEPASALLARIKAERANTEAKPTTQKRKGAKGR